MGLVFAQRSSLRRRLTLALAGLLATANLLLTTDAVPAVVWREPIAAWGAHAHQRVLERQLSAASAGPDTRALAPAAHAREQRQAGQKRATVVRRLDAALSGRALGRISIPRLDARFVFVQDVGPEQLKLGPGHYLGTALPGTRHGLVGIAGHRTTYLAPFRHVDLLHRGDRIALTMPYGRFVYRVTALRVVSPSDTTVLDPPSGGPQRLVLSTCTPAFTATSRLVVMATLTSAHWTAISGTP
jgi:sortase A